MPNGLNIEKLYWNRDVSLLVYMPSGIEIW